MDYLREQGHTDALPINFSDQIREALTKELDFTNEKRFSDKLRLDLTRRNLHRPNQVAIPEIYFSSDDVLLESLAEGISLRSYDDLRKQAQTFSESGYGHLSEAEIYKTVLIEGIGQLVNTGKMHVDLHPGNIFVNKEGKITLIDLGMHEELSETGRLQTISLLAGLTVGNANYVKKMISSFGYNVQSVPLQLNGFRFEENTKALLRLLEHIPNPSHELSSIIISASKLAPYARNFSRRDMIGLMYQGMNKKELSRFLLNITQAGGAMLLDQAQNARRNS